MSRRDHLLELLADTTKETAIPAPELARAMGIRCDTFGTYARPLLDTLVISRLRIQGKPHLRYYLTPEQKAAIQNGTSVSAGAAAAPATQFALIADTHDIPARIAYLKNLRDNTLLGEHKILSLILQDYERTLALRKAISTRLEAEAA